MEYGGSWSGSLLMQMVERNGVRPEWVSSSLSVAYQPNGSYWVYTGCPATIFRGLISERLLLLKAAI